MRAVQRFVERAIASPKDSGRLAGRLLRFDRSLGLQSAAVRDQCTSLGKPLQLRLAQAEFAEHLSVVLSLESRRADRRQLIRENARGGRAICIRRRCDPAPTGPRPNSRSTPSASVP